MVFPIDVPVSDIPKGTLGQELKALCRGYFWIDYLSIPQARWLTSP